MVGKREYCMKWCCIYKYCYALICDKRLIRVNSKKDDVDGDSGDYLAAECYYDLHAAQFNS